MPTLTKAHVRAVRCDYVKGTIDITLRCRLSRDNAQAAEMVAGLADEDEVELKILPVLTQLPLPLEANIEVRSF